jgi:hypothetical protein
LSPPFRVRATFAGSGFGSIGSKSLARTGGRFVPFVRGSRGVNVGSWSDASEADGIVAKVCLSGAGENTRVVDG